MSTSGPTPVSRTFDARVAELGFTLPLPPDWVGHELPAEEPDFGNPTLLVPLAVVTAPHSALIFAIAARPAYEDGALHDWAQYLLQHHGLTPRTLGVHAVGTLPAIVGEAVQSSDMGPMIVRFAFCEDGRRLLNLTLSAPEMLAGAVQGLWFEILSQFVLTTPRGPTVPVMAGTPVGNVEAPPSAAAAVAVARREAEEAAQTRAAAEKAALDASPAPVDSPIARSRSGGSAATFRSHALADSPATLDPEHPINTNLRERGIGLTPNLLAVDAADCRVTLGAGALGSIIDVPFGWHVLDDGARTLLLDPSNEVQIHLELVPRDDRDNGTILDACESGATDAYPSPRFVRHPEGPVFGLAVSGIQVAGEPVEQVHLFRELRPDGMMIRARITSTPARVDASTNLADLILRSARYGIPSDQEDEEMEASGSELSEEVPAPSTPTPGGPPAWFLRAQELELAGDVAGAERLIKDSVPNAWYATVIADMHRDRMLRFRAAGDLVAARAAREAAVDWIGTFATFATSGGEGAAFSYERDQFLANLPEV